MSVTLVLSHALAEQLAGEARAAFPRECCGLIEGVPRGDIVRATVFHPTRNLSRDDHRFEIDPAEPFRLMRALRGTGRGIVGCYHSHPHGVAAPSRSDRENGGENGFIWLIAAPAGREGAVRLGAFISRGADLVSIVLMPS